LKETKNFYIYSLAKRNIVENKNHWYDGFFYDFVIAPNQDTAFEIVEQFILPGSTVIDVGCATGRFPLNMKRNYSRIDGVDLSKRNIEIADKKKKKLGKSSVFFYHDDVILFLRKTKRTYDYAVMSYMIHEVDAERRNEILKELSLSADSIIIVDYLIPRPSGIWTWLNEAVEFIAGKDHYRNFKTFAAAGGIKGLAEQSGLRIVQEKKNIPSTTHIALLKRGN
jgi:SAM-dependent methyltransferase